MEIDLMRVEIELVILSTLAAAVLAVLAVGFLFGASSTTQQEPHLHYGLL
jgi:hypothetical protein